MASSNVAAILGVGSGLGAAVARRFVRGGYAVALLARRLDALQVIERDITAAGGTAGSFVADATDPGSVAAAFAAVRARMGDPEVFVYNAGAFLPGGVAEVTPQQFEACWKANCFGAFLGAHEVIPAMLSLGRGTILLTGATAALRGSANYSCLSVGKFGLRALGESLARELHPRGIHVAHIILDGAIATPRARAMFPGRPTHTLLDPDSIAEAYWQVHRQGPTTWTHELDMRPAVEKF